MPVNALLPEAQLDIFVSQTNTKQVVETLPEDWRFSRVKINIIAGDIYTAIEYYSSQRSPDILLIETDDIDTRFTDQLEHLAAVCLAHTGAVFIGPQNDVALYRRLVNMGASDYLVRPISPPDLRDILAKILMQKVGTSTSRNIVFMGGKGGVGTTKLQQWAALTMAEKFEEKTVLVEASGGWATAQWRFGISNTTSLRDAVSMAKLGLPEGVDELLHPVHPYLDVLAVSGDALLSSPLAADGYENLLDTLMRRHATTLVDLSQSPTGIRHMAVSKAQHIALITTPTPASLRATRLLMQEIQQLRGADAPISLIVNQLAFIPSQELSMEDIVQTLGQKPALVLPFHKDLAAWLNQDNTQQKWQPLKYEFDGIQAQMDRLVSHWLGKTLLHQDLIQGVNIKPTVKKTWRQWFVKG
jgi:pilus assembly protein CpaE